MPANLTSSVPPLYARPPVGGGLAYAVFAAPAAWAAQLIAGYALAAHACFPLAVPLVRPLWGGLWWMLIGIDVVAMLVAGSGLVLAFRYWRIWWDADPADLGGRRNRFIANWAALISVLFSIALLFTIVMLFIEPVCNR